MNNLDRKLYKYVSENDYTNAKETVKIILEKNKAKKNETFCKYIIEQLDSSTTKLLELPHALKDSLYLEDVRNFKENRFYLSKRENQLLKDITKMYEVGKELHSLGINYLNSIMLFGETGTGKTLFARFLAYKLDLPFAYINLSNCVSSYLGATSKSLHKIFDLIKNKNCVFMLDELDSIASKRGGKSDVGEMNRIVISLIQELDNVKNNKSIIIAATNREDIIDPAIKRRFSLKHEVKPFTVDEKQEMIIKFLDDISYKYCKDNIKEYCKKEINQSMAMNTLKKCIANSIENKSKFVEFKIN